MAVVYLVITSVVIGLVTSNSQLSNRPFYSDIPGDYCSTRSYPCCESREDDCSVPIMGTLCYCDQFCNRVINPDCCPDYPRVCQKYIPTPPPAITRVCEHNGIQFMNDESVEDNCNTCTCIGGFKSCTNKRCLVESEMLDSLQITAPWRVSNYSMFWGRELDEGMLLRTGTKEPANRENKNPILLHYEPNTLPTRFDSREKWAGLIGPALDQGWCGSSWAFSTSTVASDRFSIHSKGLEKISLSTQNLVDCDKKGQQGCNGGRLQRAWNYLRRFGVVDDPCYPYTSGLSGTEGNCRIRRGMNLATFRCAGAPQLSGRKELYHTQPAHRIKSNEQDIMFEIMTDGPVQAVMKVHQDFFVYRGGVYSHVGPSHSSMQHHSVRLIGWGEEIDTRGSRVKYWIAVNSWGPEWGEGGTFRIRKGVNESGIEDYILSVRPKLDRNRRRRRRRRHGHGGRSHLIH